MVILTTLTNQQLHCGASLSSLRMDAHADYQPSSEYDYYSYIENSTDDGLLHFNITCSSSHLQGSNIFLPILYYLIFFTGFFGNLFVISVVGSKGGRGGRLVDTFVVNLALADLIFVLTLPLWAISASQDSYWNFGPSGDMLCRLSSYIIAVNCFSNILYKACTGKPKFLYSYNSSASFTNAGTSESFTTGGRTLSE